MNERTLILHWGQSGGGTRFHYELCRARADSAASYTLVSYNTRSDQAAAMGALRTPHLKVRTYRSKLGVILGLPRLVLTAIRLVIFLRRNSVTQVVSSMESIYQSIAVPLLLSKGVRYVSIIHDASQHPGDEHLLKRIGRRLELRRADEIVTLSRAVTDSLVASGVKQERIRTLYHPAFGAPTGNSSPRVLPSNREIVVGCFGRLMPYKGIDIFVDALAELSRTGHRVVGRIVGQGPEARLRSRAGAEHIDWRVGWIAEEEVDKVIQGFDVLALTYREASQSGVVAHAWANGVPVITTPVGGLREQVAETGCGVVAESVSGESVASAIVKTIEDEAKYRAMSKAALAAASRYSWEAFVSELGTGSLGC